MSAYGESVPGIAVTSKVSFEIDWAALGEWLGDISSISQRDLLGAFVESLQQQPLGVAILAERFLLQEKDDPEARATREAVQRFCRELLAHLDEGSR